jgi:hypothetical protein
LRAPRIFVSLVLAVYPQFCCGSQNEYGSANPTARLKNPID